MSENIIDRVWRWKQQECAWDCWVPVLQSRSYVNTWTCCRRAAMFRFVHSKMTSFILRLGSPTCCPTRWTPGRIRFMGTSHSVPVSQDGWSPYPTLKVSCSHWSPMVRTWHRPAWCGLYCKWDRLRPVCGDWGWGQMCFCLNIDKGMPIPWTIT